MKSKINNLSDVFKEAKNHLWSGEGYRTVNGKPMKMCICHAIESTGDSYSLIQTAKNIVLSRLGRFEGYNHTVESYLHFVLGVDKHVAYYNEPRVQQYRRDWLTSLENEFKPKLKPKKGFSVHHIDGNLNNNDLGNMVYVKTQGQNKFK